MKKNIIWSNLDLNIDDWREAYTDFLKANDFLKTDPNDEDAIYRWMYETMDLYLSDVRDDLDIPTDGRILIIADLGLWNGRQQGYKIINRNVKNILSTNGDYAEWYSDGHNIKATIHHHDGTNYLTYREIREDRNIDNLLNAIYNGEEISRQKLNYYTKSLQPYLTQTYGW